MHNTHEFNEKTNSVIFTIKFNVFFFKKKTERQNKEMYRIIVITKEKNVTHATSSSSTPESELEMTSDMVGYKKIYRTMTVK